MSSIAVNEGRASEWRGMPTPKRCPGCNRADCLAFAPIHESRTFWRVVCHNCGHAGHVGRDKLFAVYCWNRRKQLPCS